MADLLPRSPTGGRKRRRLIRRRRGTATFLQRTSFLGRQCRGISEVTKGRIRTKGARTLEQRTDNGLSKNIGAEKSPCTPHLTSIIPGLEASILSEKNYPREGSPLSFLQKPILDVVTFIDKKRSMDTRRFQIESLSLMFIKNLIIFLQNILKKVHFEVDLPN